MKINQFREALRARSQARNIHRNPRRRLHEQPGPRERSFEVGAGFGEMFPPFGVEADHVRGAQDVSCFCGIR